MAQVIIPYSPRYPEVHATLEARRFCVLVAHRRFGKTVLAVNHLIKTAVASRRPAGHFAYVAPFRNQAKSVAWDYLKRYCRNFPGLRINESELACSIPSAGGGAKVRIFGADNPDALRGLYFDGVVMDEVAQMKPDVWEEIVQPALADRQGYAVFIGTPKGVNLFSELYYHALKEQAEGSQTWAALCYPVTETNALPAEEVERLRQELSDNKFRQEMLCDFSASGEDVIISLDEAHAAFDREIDQTLIDPWPVVVGVDIARFGEDATVFFRRRGRRAFEPLIIRKKNNVEVAQRLAAYIAEVSPALVNIDQGQGTGVIDLVRELAGSRPVVINEVPFGSKAGNDAKYVNKRAEMWMEMRDWIRSGGSLPKGGKTEQALLAELTSPLYSYDSHGRIKLEPKEDIKKRLKRSTDLGDALALTFAAPVAPIKEVALGMNKSHSQSAAHWLANEARESQVYDPFSIDI